MNKISVIYTVWERPYFVVAAQFCQCVIWNMLLLYEFFDTESDPRVDLFVLQVRDISILQLNNDNN
jgi:hypothetical protein